jgi:farnesyl-diphosphate farnesyltransferase
VHDAPPIDDTTAAPMAPVTLRDARRFCVAVLPRVSRTFALSIRVLPGELGRSVLAAYLICRIADTVEDAPGLDAGIKAALLDALMVALDDPAAADEYPALAASVTGNDAHVALVRHADQVLMVYRALPDDSRVQVRHWVREMIGGMRDFVLRYPHGIRIQTLEEYKEYCYYVAGTVGYMLTDLWRLHTPSISEARYQVLRERCRAFAEALQTVNILKDVAADAEQENSIYVPAQDLAAHGSSHATLLSPEHLPRNAAALRTLMDLALADCDLALEYLLLLPRRAVSIRLFCLLPLAFAFATLRELLRSTAMLRPGGTVKIGRGEVRALLATAPFVVGSNAAVRWLVGRIRRRPFRLLPERAVG